MLQFVDLSQGGYDAGKDLQTRKQVRSQAMRDFRRRQRAEREAALQIPTLLLRSEATKGTVQSAEGPQKHSNSGESSADVESSHQKPTRRNKKPSIAQSRRKGSSAGCYAQLLLSELQSGVESAEALNGDYHATSLKHPSMSSSIPSQSRATSKSSSVLRGLSCWSIDSGDIFQSPAQIKQMLVFCTSYIHWLRPGVDSQLAASILAQTWDTSRCPMLLAACCLASVGHLDAVQQNRPSGNYAVYKDRVLREVSERMQTFTSATSDDTIGALACLLSFEMSRGSGEALTHLQGLKSIVNMKGGVEESSLAGISTMLETLDLLHAALFDAEPVLTAGDLLESPMQSDLSDADIFVHLTPLLIAEQVNFHQRDIMYKTPLQQLPELLQTAFDLLNGVLKNSPDPNLSFVPSISIEHFEACIEQFGQLASSNLNTAPDASNLVRTCHLNLVIIFNLVRHRIPHRHYSNQKYADGLYSAFRSVSDQAWEHLSYLRLWILLTGAVASSDLTRKSYFKAQLVRAIYQMGAGEFRRIKSFMLGYLEVKQVLEHPNRRSTPPIELVTPISGETSFLYASWPGVAQSQSKSPLTETVSLEGSLSQPSPLSFGDPSLLAMSSSQQSVNFDDMIDPVLKHADLEPLDDFAAFHRRPTDATVSNGLFNDGFYTDMWLTGGPS